MAGGPGGDGGGIQSNSVFWSVVMSLFAAFGGILFGYDTGTISGIIAMDDWLHTFGKFDESLGFYLPTKDKSLVVSILSAGTFFGALLAYPLGDRLGRKLGIMVGCLVFFVGTGLQLDTAWVAFVIGRVVAGFGVGIVSCLVPMYQSECAPKSIRGLIVGAYQLAITIGALLAAIVLNATKDEQSHSSWRTPIGVQFAWGAILGGGMIFLPESPRFLLLKGKQAAARKALGRLMSAPADSPDVEEECLAITAALTLEQSETAASYLDCFKNNEAHYGLRTWTGIWLQAWQQLTGINFIFYYGTTFFMQAGIKNPFIITIIADVVNTAMTLIGLPFIDRLGRRKLLLIGAAGMCFCEFIVAIVGVTAGDVQPDGSVNLAAQRVLIAFVCIYIAFFAISWGPVGWVVTSEVSPLAIRAKAMSLSVASNWLWNFAIGYATPYLVNPTTYGINGEKAANLGVKVFFIWGGTCAGSFIFTYFFIPETRGLSLEQIDRLYKESSIVNSTSYRQKIIDSDNNLDHSFGLQQKEVQDIQHVEHEKLADSEKSSTN
ncbi:Major facilitator-type transporter ecdD [Psilocybe cubensis]|uniref:Major facilitator superfamily (MFS) profile domain-containing protein n=2 Tax=Psilocybe cubensis TaxID=181762 RepID=A0A8H7Y006_PSICU|nr:Major facilitator-type transporter ecdD [Psilocybe cubensis]KAH9482121.1 Major facilitator-type transporter ecdD [Psilocybe cubensis]